MIHTDIYMWSGGEVVIGYYLHSRPHSNYALRQWNVFTEGEGEKGRREGERGKEGGEGKGSRCTYSPPGILRPSMNKLSSSNIIIHTHKERGERDKGERKRRVEVLYYYCPLS